MEVLGVPIVVAPLDMSYQMYAQEMTWHAFEPETHRVSSLQPPRTFKCFACFWWVYTSNEDLNENSGLFFPLPAGLFETPEKLSPLILRYH